jgi:hypothetical protein
MSNHWIDPAGNKIMISMSLVCDRRPGGKGCRKCFVLFSDGPSGKKILTEPNLMDATSRLQAEEIVQQYGDRNGWRTEEEEDGQE